MKSRLLIIVTLVSVSFGYSQYRDVNVTTYGSLAEVGSIYGESEELNGTSYIDENFQSAKLLKNSNIFPARYNAFKDEMEIQNEEKIYNIKKKYNSPINFLKSSKTYQVYDYLNSKGKGTGYFVVLYNGAGEGASLLLHEKIKFEEEVVKTSGYNNYSAPTLERVKDKMYISFKSNIATELPRSQKSILNLFGDSSKKIKSYAQKHKLSFKEKQDLIQILKYYNSL